MAHRMFLWFVIVGAVFTLGCTESSTENTGAPAEGEIARFLEENPEMQTPETEPEVR